MIHFKHLTKVEQAEARAYASAERSDGASYDYIAEGITKKFNCSMDRRTVWRWFNDSKEPLTTKAKVAEQTVATVTNMVDDLLDKMEAVKNMSPAQRMLYFADRQLTRQAMIATVIDEMVMVEMVALQRKEEVDTKLLYLLSSLSKNYNIRPSEMLRIAEYAEQIGDTSDDPITFTATKEANTGQPKATT